MALQTQLVFLKNYMWRQFTAFLRYDHRYTTVPVKLALNLQGCLLSFLDYKKSHISRKEEEWRTNERPNEPVITDCHYMDHTELAGHPINILLSFKGFLIINYFHIEHIY